MSGEDWRTPMRAREGMATTIVETYVKLVQIEHIVVNPTVMRRIMDQCQIPPDDRMAVLEAMTLRSQNLQSAFQQQVANFATLLRQASE